MDNIKDKIINILRECEVEEEDIYNYNFIENEILESLQIAEIVMNLEDVFSIEIDGADIIPENFINIEEIEKLIIKYLEKNVSSNKAHSAGEILWDSIARQAQNAIEQSGWKSSFDGKVFSQVEMNEFYMNVKYKVTPYINNKSRILEIGVGSGMIAEIIAPICKEYIGVDISKETIRKTEKRMSEIKNVFFIQGNALDIANMQINKCDVVIINSVIQYLSSFKELIQLINEITKVIDSGIIFIGDILDIGKKNEYDEKIKRIHGKANKTDNWYSKEQIESLAKSVDRISKIQISEKCGYTIKNELNQYRFDAICKVD